jgi:hypothetical protein
VRQHYFLEKPWPMAFPGSDLSRFNLAGIGFKHGCEKTLKSSIGQKNKLPSWR